MNKSLHQYLVLFSVAFLLFSCEQSTQSRLVVPIADKDIKVDGNIGEEEWAEYVLLGNFLSPWDKNGSDNTKFSAFVSSKYFNFSFQVQDSTIITVPFEKELSVANEDRVELFFAKDTTLAEYYCIEIDPKGNVLDYSAMYYRDFEESWNFTSKKIAAKITDSGYIVEGKISLDELNELGISTPFYLGVFRADYKSNRPDDVTWYSWILPNSLHPDFHIPSAFGKSNFSRNTGEKTGPIRQKVNLTRHKVEHNLTELKIRDFFPRKSNLQIICILFHNT